MLRLGIAAIAVSTALLTGAHAQATDPAKLPDWTGQWVRAHLRSQWDPSKPRGLQQEAPFTEEYLEIFKANLAQLKSSGQGVDPQLRCIPSGTPRMMMGYEPLEVIVTPETTYIRVDHLAELRRIFTDGRDWPKNNPPAWEGYSIGHWLDEDGDGKYDVLEVETRGPFKGPRYLDADGLPLHRDNRTVVKERIYLDQKNPETMHAQITTIDHAFTRPWTVVRDYKRERHPVWPEYLCNEANHHVVIGKARYFISADGLLMPTQKGQAPPDLRYFKQPK